MELPTIRGEPVDDGLHRRYFQHKNHDEDDNNSSSSDDDSITEDIHLTADDYNLNEKEFIEKYLNRTVWQDLLQSLYDVRLTAPLFLMLGLFLAYHLTIAPYRTHIIDLPAGAMNRNRDMDLSKIRPVLTKETQFGIMDVTLRAETAFLMLPPNNRSISLRFHQSVSHHGNREPPDIFYEGVMFGLTTQNSHSLEYGFVSAPPLIDLQTDLENMKPKPTFIVERSVTCNHSDWTEQGLAVYFSYNHLRQQGKLSSDRLQPWKRVKDDILWIARKYKQVYITVWYPHQFGDVSEAEVTETQKHRHETIIQQIIPTRTGLDAVKSTAAVWMASDNGTDPGPLRPNYVYKKAWTMDDHWHNYTTNSTDIIIDEASSESSSGSSRIIEVTAAV